MENLPENTSPTQIPKWLIIAGVIVIFFLLLLLGWWAYNRLFQTQTAIENQNTNGWTDYTSQKCKYQVSYPPAWYIYTDAEQEDLAAVLITSSPVQSETVSINEARVQIGCSSFDSFLTSKIVVDDLNVRYQGKGFSISPIQQTTMGGKIAYYQTVSSNQTGSLKEYYIFPANNRVVIINIVPLNSSQIDMAETVLKKIIFLD